ncbi:MAG: ABC transporter permease [Actinomycetia bacterium]|nr:ABC transporter permease [Actinomycetes bacterium]MCP4957840.1 ABC transporter permease [Actinomycetes bacterium]
MIARLGYFLRETSINIRRNITLTLAAILTVAIAAMLVGGVLLASQAVDNATERWEDGVEFIVFLDPEITGVQSDSIGQELANHPDIERFSYFGKADAYDEFVAFFPDFAETVEPESLPPSYRIVPRDASADVIASLAAQFSVRPGVFEVVSAQDSIRQLRDLGTTMNRVLLLLVAFLSLAAVLLIYNSIRVAMFARRREIEVQKLVGATNSFIRLPFVIEGLINGLVGGVLGVLLLVSTRSWMSGVQANLEDVAIFGDLEIRPGQFQGTAMLVILIALALGAIGSGFAAGRFLDV